MAGALLGVVLACGWAAPAEDAERAFARLYAAAWADPRGADFAGLRMAAVRRPGHDPDTPGGLDLEALERELANGERAAARVALDRLMAGREADAEAHAQAAEVCERIGLDDRADRHAALAAGLLRSALRSGDGRTAATAYSVTGAAEERLVLARLGLAAPRREATPYGNTLIHVYTSERVGGGRIEVFFRPIAGGEGR
jgi:hypothetical protein